jgi:hypothetical protein
VDEVMKNVKNLPQELVDEYYNMVRENVKKRVQSDEDYKEFRKNGATPFEYLDKLL